MTRDEKSKANVDNEVLIPMIVDMDSADEHGMLAGYQKVISVHGESVTEE